MHVEPGLHRRAFERRERSNRSTTARCTAGRSPVDERRARNRQAVFVLRSRPPRARPSASITALTAPAEVPETPSTISRSSLSKCSSTPHVNAPCAPPPCSARLMRLVFGAPGVPAARPGKSDGESVFRPCAPHNWDAAHGARRQRLIPRSSRRRSRGWRR